MSDELSVKLPDTVVRVLTVLARAGYVGTSPAGIASYLVMRGIDDLIRAGVLKHTDLLDKRLPARVESAAAQKLVTAPAGECGDAKRDAPETPPVPTPVATAGATPAISKATTAAQPMRTPERKVLMLDLYQTTITLDRLAERMNALPGRPMERHNVSEWGKDLHLMRRGLAIPIKYLPKPTAGAPVRSNDGRPARLANLPPPDGDEDPEMPKPPRVNRAFPSFLLKWGLDRGLQITLPLDGNQMAQINAKACHLGLPPFELAGR